MSTKQTLPGVLMIGIFTAQFPEIGSEALDRRTNDSSLYDTKVTNSAKVSQGSSPSHPSGRLPHLLEQDLRNSPSFRIAVDHGHFSIELHAWQRAESCTFATFVYEKAGEMLLRHFTGSMRTRSSIERWFLAMRIPEASTVQLVREVGLLIADRGKTAKPVRTEIVVEF